MRQRRRSRMTRSIPVGFFCLLLCAVRIFQGLWARDDTSSTSHVRRSAMLEGVVLTISAFFWTVRFSGVRQYESGRM